MDTAERFLMSQPKPLVFALVALALIVFTQFCLGVAILMGMVHGPPALVVGAIAGALVWLGLYYRHRWAFVTVLLLCPLNVLFAFSASKNPAIALILNALVFVPVVMSSHSFWGPPTQAAGKNGQVE